MVYTSKPPPPSSSSVAAVSDDDGCSICLEPFSSRDPLTVTKCKHGYHLHCILEWSQRSKECPICCRQLVLNDSDSELSSHTLLAAVEFDNVPEVCEVNNVVDVGVPHVHDSDLRERILQHSSGFTNRACFGNRMRRQTSSRIGQAQVLPSFPVAGSSNMHQVSGSEKESQGPVNELENGLAASGISSSTIGPAPSVAVGLSEPSPENPQKLSSSKFLDLEPLKTGVFAASSRCNELFSRKEQGFKEKLVAHNICVKELSREVQREMSVSIAGLAKMVERLDLISRRGGASGWEPQTLGRKKNL